MRKLNYFLSFAAIVAVMNSCQEVELDQDGIGTTIGNLTFTAEVSPITEAGTRSSLDDLSFSWVSSDAIGVYVKSLGTDIAPAEFEYSEVGALPFCASFTGDIVVTTTEEYAYAVYPYNGEEHFTTVDNAAQYTFTLPATQIQNHDESGVIDPKSVGAYTFKYGRSTDMVSIGGSSALIMTDLMAIHDITIKGIPAGRTVYSVVLSSSTSLATAATVDLDGSVAILSGAKAIRVDLNGAAGIQVKGGELTVRLVSFPENVVDGTEWTLAVNSAFIDGEIETKSITKTLEAKKYEGGIAYRSNFVFDATVKGLAVELATTGQLGVTLSAIPDFATITSLTITGAALDKADCSYLNTNMKVLTHLDILGTATEVIENGSFQGNNYLTTVLTNVKTIELHGFRALVNLSFLYFPQVENIGAWAVAECYALKTITLPETLTLIGSNSFTSSPLEECYLPSVPPILAANSGLSLDVEFVVHSVDVKSAYIHAFEWSLFYNVDDATKDQYSVITGSSTAILQLDPSNLPLEFLVAPEIKTVMIFESSSADITASVTDGDEVWCTVVADGITNEITVDVALNERGIPRSTLVSVSIEGLTKTFTVNQSSKSQIPILWGTTNSFEPGSGEFIHAYDEVGISTKFHSDWNFAIYKGEVDGPTCDVEFFTYEEDITPTLAELPSLNEIVMYTFSGNGRVYDFDLYIKTIDAQGREVISSAMAHTIDGVESIYYTIVLPETYVGVTSVAMKISRGGGDFVAIADLKLFEY